jgi:hypothetical protein
MNRFQRFLQNNGLMLVFFGLFVVCLAGQALTGRVAYNELQALHGLPPAGLPHYVTTSHFLQGAFSNWQAAILQLGMLIFLGIFLRQWGAPHSLPPGRRPGQTRGPQPPGKASRRVEPKASKRGRAKRSSWLWENSLSLAFGGLFLLVFVLHLLTGWAANNDQRPRSAFADGLLRLGEVLVLDTADVGSGVHGNCVVPLSLDLSAAEGFT